MSSIYDEIVGIYDVVHLGLGRRQLKFSQKYYTRQKYKFYYTELSA